MKKIFSARRNALLSPADFSWGAYALIGAVLVLLVRLLAPNFFWYIFSPIFQSADALATRSHLFFSSFGDTARLALENEKLSKENAALTLENQSLLRKANALSGLGGGQGITAGVVARPPESPYDTLVLAAGARAGIAIGMEVFGAGGVPVGRISSVLADFSRATLFSSPGVTTAGWVGHAAVPLVITGSGAGVMQASLARSANIAVGDTVFAPGPGMLPLGTVARVESDPSSTSVTLRIAPALNLFSIAWVVVRDTGEALNMLPQTTSTLP
ncbi:rod shape-determining protein MreC [Candidatus Kaiserbacteria bacterium]|nr:rod shape-determining protein MreC [Candidatus Kaiserbacteria bacterium]